MCVCVDRSFTKPRSDQLGLKNQLSSSCNLGQEQKLSLTHMEKLFISNGSKLVARNCLQLVPSRSTQPKTKIPKNIELGHKPACNRATVTTEKSLSVDLPFVYARILVQIIDDCVTNNL